MTEDIFGLLGTVVQERYRIDAVVGEGGFGIVYRGHHLSFDHPIAVKCLKIPPHFNAEAKQTFLSKFWEEGRMLSKLSSHPAIVRVFDLGVHVHRGENVPYLVLEWLNGRPLSALLEQNRGKRLVMTERQACAILRPIVEALAAVHVQGIAHRDVKPENVFLTEGSKGSPAKLLDFGIAKAMQEGDKVTHIGGRTSSNFSAFSPQYGAPEQFRTSAFGATGPWTDVHAIGLILTEMTCGQIPLGDGDFGDMLVRATDARRPTPRVFGANVSAEFETMVSKCVALDPRHRFPDGNALLTEIDRVYPRDGRSSMPNIKEFGGTVVASGSGPHAAIQQGLAAAGYGPPAYASTNMAGTYSAPPPAGSHMVSMPAPPPRTSSRRGRGGMGTTLVVIGALAMVGGIALAVTQPWRTDTKSSKKKKNKDKDDDDTKPTVPTAPPSDSAPVAKGPRYTDAATVGLSFTAAGIQVNGEKLTDSLPAFEALFGKADRVFELVNRLHVFDKFGFVIYEAYDEHIKAGNVYFLTDAVKFMPRGFFTGKLDVAGETLNASTSFPILLARYPPSPGEVTNFSGTGFSVLFSPSQDKLRLGHVAFSFTRPEPTPLAKHPLEAKCEAGNAKSCTGASLGYEFGTIVPKNPERSFALAKKACEGGDGYGCVLLAEHYDTGKGTPANEALARQARERACLFGESDACPK